MKCFLTIGLMLLSWIGFSQVKFDVRLSDKHTRRVEQTKDVRKKLKKYKKLMSKAEKRELKHYQDSLKSVALEQVPYDSTMILKHLPDSASRSDSIAWALNTLAQYHQNEDISEYIQTVSSVDSVGFSLDSLELTPLAEKVGSKYMPDDLDLPDASYQSLHNQHKEALMGDVPMETLSSVREAGEDPKAKIEALQENLRTDELVRLQTKLSKLKKKYVSIPDLSNPESGIKRSSLKGRPLIDRFYLGGNVAVQSTSPLVLDVDLKLGYKLDKRLSVGGGVRWREAFGAPDTTATMLSQNSHGYSLFSDYELAKGFFAHLEYGSIRNSALFQEGASFEKWQQEYLVGVGREFQIASFGSISTLFLYDFNHRNNNTHPRPFVMRIGFNLTKVPWEK